MKSAAGTRRYVMGARAEAAEETGRRIVEAFLGRLLTQWYDEITLDAVAEDAEVTVQTVVRRFGGKEGLLASAVKQLAKRINAGREVPSGDVPRIVEKVVGDYEQTGDTVIRLLALEGRHAAIKDVMDFGRSEHRRWVAGAFANQLGKLTPKVRDRALDALVIATDVYAWKILRRDLGRSAAEATVAMRSMIEATIGKISEL
jgi:AcrR family transcriptional regulator